MQIKMPEPCIEPGTDAQRCSAITQFILRNIP